MVDATAIVDYTYENFKQGIEAIATAVEQSDFKPDYIVGIVRGGSVPAVYLSHRLKIPVVMVAWNTRDDTEFGNESNTWIPEDINEGQRILVVDDIVDGGETIQELLKDWNSSIYAELNMDNVRVASLIYNVAQDVKVDFFHQTIDRNEDQRWIVFPWEA